MSALPVELLRHADFGFVHQVLTYTRRHKEATTFFLVGQSNIAIDPQPIWEELGPLLKI